MISKITLENVLPAVFADSENAFAESSQVWLKPHLTFSRGNTYMVEAESGTGKSSLCSYIYGNRTDYLGRILFDDRDIRSLKPADWCRIRCSSIALLPQEMRLFGELTVMENIEIKNRLTGYASPQTIMQRLEQAGIADKVHTLACRLSIGQQQRVATIRALCQPASFIILDEPVSHLDSRNNSLMAQMITEEAHRQGAAIIATSVGNKIDLPNAQILHL